MFSKLNKEIKNINKKYKKQRRILFIIVGISNLFFLTLCLFSNGGITEKMIASSIILISYIVSLWFISRNLRMIKISEPVKISAEFGKRKFYKFKIKVNEKEFELISIDDKQLIII